MRRVGVLIALALAGSQAGHLIAYAARFGGAALQVQSSGAHAYFPLAAKTALSVAAIGLLAALLVLALARISSRGGRRVSGGPSFIYLFAILFTGQLLLFVTQEIVEAALAGAPAGSVSAIALWGMLGQLPAAAAVAATLCWLWSRVEEAVAVLRSVATAQSFVAAPGRLSALAYQTGYVAITADHAHGSRHARRGPPTSFIG